ncbi:hypothetical protein AAVH_41433, partial [Aphelenchoides avenae]
MSVDNADAGLETITLHRPPAMKNVVLSCVVFVALLVATSFSYPECSPFGWCPYNTPCRNGYCVSDSVASRGLHKRA